MASLLEHVMINKLGDDLDAAITAVGGDTSSVDHIMDYPEIIKNQLINKNNQDDPDQPGGSDVEIDIDKIVSDVVNSEKFLEIMESFGDDEGITAEVLQWEDVTT
jgi:hypothetical protein